MSATPYTGLATYNRLSGRPFFEIPIPTKSRAKLTAGIPALASGLFWAERTREEEHGNREPDDRASG